VGTSAKKLSPKPQAPRSFHYEIKIAELTCAVAAQAVNAQNSMRPDSGAINDIVALPRHALELSTLVSTPKLGRRRPVVGRTNTLSNGRDSKPCAFRDCVLNAPTVRNG